MMNILQYDITSLALWLCVKWSWNISFSFRFKTGQVELSNANAMIYQIASFAWLIFGILLVWFSFLGDYKEYKMGKHHKNLLNNLAELRMAKGLTQQALSDSAEVSRKSINAIENGIYVPSTVLALKIAKTLGCSVEDIFKLPE